MWILFVFSIISLTIIIERWAYFSMKEKKISRNFKKDIISAVSDQNMEKAFLTCDKEKNTVSQVVREFLARCDRSDDAQHFDQLVKEIVLERIESLEKHLYILGIIGYVSPMLGLLGTVTGMIKAFGSIASQGIGNPAIVADGISQALFTTAAGLTIAIPAIVMYNLFNKRIEKVEAHTDKILTSIINVIRAN